MMIKINLLPVRAVKKREIGRQMLVLFAVLIVFAGLVNFLWYQDRASESKRNAERIAQTQQRIAELEKVIGEVNDINKRKKEVEDKLSVLDGLRKGRTGPVRMLDALATSIPKKVWLTTFDEKGRAVKLVGQALSHDDVAEFMRSLENIVWTPTKGMGRLIEQKRDAKSSRVELLAQEGAIEDFPVGQVGSFFTNVDLKRAEQSEAPVPGGYPGKLINFEISMGANYTL